MKKYLAFILMFAIAVSFAACGGSDEEEGGDPEPEDTFSWKGDWSDPNNPDFKSEDYNPIKGDWQLVSDPTVRFIFDKNHVVIYARFLSETNTWRYTQWAEKYEINDIAIKYYHQRNIYEEYKIVMENGQEVLNLRFRALQNNGSSWSTDEWRKYKRYIE